MTTAQQLAATARSRERALRQGALSWTAPPGVRHVPA
jgi:hypothetical protein